MIVKPPPLSPRGYTQPHEAASGHQQQQIATLQALLCDRRNKRVEATLDQLRSLGYRPAWLRVRWTGGVGSFAVMRRGTVRLLVSATKSGLSDPTFRTISLAPGIQQDIQIPGKRRGFRYGWCVELPRL